MLQKPVFHYCIRNSPPLVPVTSQMNSVHTLPSHILNIQSDTINPPTPCPQRDLIS